MRTDFEKLNDGDSVILYPNRDNPLHTNPVKAVYQSGYFYCNGTPAYDGPDYYFGDVLKYNDGFELQTDG